MNRIKIKRGLDVPITGAPEQVVYPGNSIRRVALIGYDYIGMKPTMEAAVGDRVKRGQTLFFDKNREKVKYTSPAGGTVTEINRGEKRVFESIVITCDDNDESLVFPSYNESRLESLEPEKIKAALLNSGLWTALRARPFGKPANPDESPHSLFVTAMDTQPLAPSIEKILEGKETAFKNGLKVISRLCSGKVFLCQSPGTSTPTVDLPSLSVVDFEGPHPAGNVGTHIHTLDPVCRGKTVWHIDAQDVAAIGLLFTTGEYSTERIVSLAGPSVKKPRLIKTRIGASIKDIVDGELTGSGNRVISGSVLSGRAAFPPVDYLGRYHQQVSALEENRDRQFLGWLSPGLNVFSIKHIFLSGLLKKKTFNFTTSQHGGKRAVFPIGSYEAVMPLDLEISYLLRAIMSEDIEESENLGCLELGEDDLALCSFVSPAKIEYGPALRHILNLIEKEG